MRELEKMRKTDTSRSLVCLSSPLPFAALMIATEEEGVCSPALGNYDASFLRPASRLSAVCFLTTLAALSSPLSFSLPLTFCAARRLATTST